MIKTPLSTVIGGAFWTPGATILGSASKTLNQIIKSLFANNEQGFAYDPNDLSTMFQDSAGTTPVTGAGQPVGLILDKSGRGNHARQTTSASRPILRKNAVTGANYLEFDGSDDFLQTGNIDFTGTGKVSLFAGVRKLSDAASGMICELSASANSNSGSFYILTAPSSLPNYSFASSVGSIRGVSQGGYAAPHSAVLTCTGNISPPLISISVNNSIDTTGDVSQGTGNYGNYPIYIGRRGGTTLPFNGHIYGLIGIGKLVLDNETAAIEKELARRIGVTLNV